MRDTYIHVYLHIILYMYIFFLLRDIRQRAFIVARWLCDFYINRVPSLFEGTGSSYRSSSTCIYLISEVNI